MINGKVLRTHTHTQSVHFHLDRPQSSVHAKEEKELARIHLNGVHSIKLMKLLINNETKQ